MPTCLKNGSTADPTWGFYKLYCRPTSFGVFIVGAKIKLYCKILIWGFYFWRLIIGGISYGGFIVGAKIKLYCKILIWGFYFWRLILGGISSGGFIFGAKIKLFDANIKRKHDTPSAPHAQEELCTCSYVGKPPIDVFP
jgi:hypothetical protein